MHAPTGNVGLSVSGPSSVFVGGDAASGAGTATGLDGRETYTLSFDGAGHPKQGYHVKLTVTTPYSQGNDTKTKVFWVQGCNRCADGAAADGAAADRAAADGAAADGAAADRAAADGAAADGAAARRGAAGHRDAAAAGEPAGQPAHHDHDEQPGIPAAGQPWSGDAAAVRYAG